MLTQKEHRWKTDLFGCFSYQDPNGNCKWCPYFIPMSVCGTCFMIGRIVTKLHGEPAIACEMSAIGFAACCFSNVLLGPPGYMLAGCFLRDQVKRKYRVVNDGPDQCNALCYPCSYFQMFVSIKEWESEDTEPSAPAIPNPIIYEPPSYK